MTGVTLEPERAVADDVLLSSSGHLLRVPAARRLGHPSVTRRAAFTENALARQPPLWDDVAPHVRGLIAGGAS